MSAEDRELVRSDVSCFAWVCVFVLVGCISLSLSLMALRYWCTEKEEKATRGLLAEQMKELKRGDVDCLVQPDPRFVDELLADMACASKVRTLYLGTDVSDPRLGRLRELPNLRSVVLLAADEPDEFLKTLRGSTTIEELTLVFCSPSRQGIEYITSLPNLKKFGLCIGRMDANDWEALRRALPHCECKRVESNR
jgi:hypothetical protein